MSTLKKFFTDYRNPQKVVLIGPMPIKNLLADNYDSPIIFVDGGLKHKPRLTETLLETPHFSVGDSDSSEVSLDEKLPAEKDFSDLSYVLQNMPDSITEVILLGFLGGRTDHEIINFGEVHSCLTSRENCKFSFENSVVAISKGQWNFEFKGAFSTFCFEQNFVQIAGEIKYAFEGQLKPFSSHGLSNEGMGEFIVTAATPLFLFFN